MSPRYLLDTNICIFFMRGKYDLDQKLRSVGGRNCFISSITVAELYYGAACSTNPVLEKQRVSMFVSNVNVLPIDNCLETFAECKAQLRHQGTMIDDFDLLIGATAIANHMIAVTENVKHLGMIPGIRIENWINRF